MKERWKALASLLAEEFGIEVQPSYEGWGAGWDPRHLPLLEAWARGEAEEIPPEVRRPKGVLFNVVDLMRRREEVALNTLRHEIGYLLTAHFPHWRMGQREVFRAGYVPTSFLVLLAVLESMKADHRIASRIPSALEGLKARYRELLGSLNPPYPHHRTALALLSRWARGELGSGAEEDRYVSSLERFVLEYIREEDPQTSYDILMEDIWPRFRGLVDLARELNQVDLLLEEARGRKREDAHRGRIMTDVLSRLPEDVRRLVVEFKHTEASRMDPEARKRVLKALGALPDWMRDYLRQMSYLDMLEKDLRFLRSFLPRTLEVDIEHRGFLSFVFKPWEEEPLTSGKETSQREEGLSPRDRKFLKEHGLREEDFRRYRSLMRSVLPYVDHFKRKFDSLLPQEEERWGGSHYRGRRLNFRKIPTEVPIRRGRIYARREVPERKDIALELLLDISASMKKEDKIHNALRSLILFSEVLHRLGIPFSVKAFNERVYDLKDFEEDYRNAKARIMEIPSRVGGGTDLGRAIGVGLESLEVYTKKTGKRGIIILFTDGEPTRGIKGEDLKAFILEAKKRFPVIGVGVGEATALVKEYFERTGISVDDVSKLPSAFSFVIENQLRRLISVR
jgi:uncharacterized protein YegL